MSDKHNPDFLHGAAMILAELARMSDDGDQMARMLLDHFELTLDDFIAAGVDGADLAELRRAFAAPLPDKSSL